MYHKSLSDWLRCEADDGSGEGDGSGSPDAAGSNPWGDEGVEVDAEVQVM